MTSISNITNDLNNVKNIKTIWSDLEIFGATKLEPGCIDISFLINTIHQSKKPIEVLRETVRITKKGGKIVIIDWSQNSSPMGPIEGNKIDKNKLVDASKKIGLYLENEFTAGQYHFGLVLTKI